MMLRWISCPRTHIPTTPNGRWPGGPGKQADTQHQLLAMVAAAQAASLGKPLYITEWSSILALARLITIRQPCGVHHQQCSLCSPPEPPTYSYWTFSDV